MPFWGRTHLKKLSLAEFYNYAIKHNFELIVEGEKVELYQDPREYVCLCCGNLRVMRRSKARCLLGLKTPYGVYTPQELPCPENKGYGRCAHPEDCQILKYFPPRERCNYII